ncbi:MAG: STAS domain-containing protein [Chloroflexi bacterium]|nr:STAS domain-containing protein [Chloroflexota bacterium]
MTVVTVWGNVDTNSFEPLMSFVQKLIDGGARHFLLDLEKVPYMGSAGLRVMNSMFNQLRALSSDMSEDDVLNAVNEGTYKSPYLKLLNMSTQSRVAFETAGFDMFLETHIDLKAAIESF